MDVRNYTSELFQGRVACMTDSLNIFEQVEQAFRELEETTRRMDEVLKSGERLLVVRQVRAATNRSRLNECCAAAMNELGVSVCMVTLLDEQVSQIAASSAPISVDSNYPANQSMCQYVVTSGKAIELDDTVTYCAFTPGLNGMADVGMHSYYGEPLVVMNQVVGSFCALDVDPRHWTEDERTTVRKWADVVGAFCETEIDSVKI